MNSKWFLAPLCAVVAVVVGLYKSDAFTKFVANLSALDKTYIVYKNFKGPFKQYMVADKYFTMLYMAIFKKAPKEWVSGGIYYDHPKEDPNENEWALYWVVSPEEYEALDMTNTPFQKTIIPKGRVVEVDAYYKNFLSIPIIINKAYPVLNKYVEDNKLPTYASMEMYYNSTTLPMRYMIYVDETDVFKKMKEMEPTPLKDIQF